MKITKQQLKQIIKEELAKVMDEIPDSLVDLKQELKRLNSEKNAMMMSFGAPLGEFSEFLSLEDVEDEIKVVKAKIDAIEKRQGGEQSKVFGSSRRLEEDDSSIR